MKIYKIKQDHTYLAVFIKLFILATLFSGMSSVVLSQVRENSGSIAGAKVDNLIIVKNNSYVLNIDVSRETLINISIFDDSGKLIDVLLYEYIKPGRLEYDLAKQLPSGNFTCKIIVGENTEVLRLIVI